MLPEEEFYLKVQSGTLRNAGLIASSETAVYFLYKSLDINSFIIEKNGNPSHFFYDGIQWQYNTSWNPKTYDKLDSDLYSFILKFTDID